MNDKKMNAMADGVSKGMAEVMKPVFDNMASELNSLMRELKNAQQTSMKEMADAFLSEMKNASGQVFEKVAEQSMGVAKLQAKTVSDLASMMQKMEEDKKTIETMYMESRKLLAEVAKMHEEQSANMAVLSEVSENVSALSKDASTRINKEIEIYKKLEFNHASWMSDCKTCTESLNESAKTVIGNLTECASTLDSVAKSVEDSLNSTCDSLQNSIDDYHARVDVDINNTFKMFDDNMSSIAGTLGKAATDIAETAERIPKAIKGSIDELQHSLK